MKLGDLRQLVETLGRYDNSTEIEFTKDDDSETKMELSHVHHFREITTPVYPCDDPIGQVDTLFIVFGGA